MHQGAQSSRSKKRLFFAVCIDRDNKVGYYIKIGEQRSFRNGLCCLNCYEFPGYAYSYAIIKGTKRSL